MAEWSRVMGIEEDKQGFLCLLEHIKRFPIDWIVGKKFLTLSVSLMLKTTVIVTRCLGNGTCIRARKSTNLKIKIISQDRMNPVMVESMDEAGCWYPEIGYRMFDKDGISSQQISLKSGNEELKRHISSFEDDVSLIKKLLWSKQR
ncbi:hypothetical protein VNO77_21709 [Canavalia gladiata]|uniref:Uncharacterized protein n=1 Tax=Canavalia gladiata TaxID=3824 RepID=A0AAN9L179_CANGL